MSEKTPQQWFDDIKKSLQTQFEDITNIEVITAVAEDITPPPGQITDMEELKKVTVKNISYYARTTMQLDGDIYTLLPSGTDLQLREQVLEIHKENIKAAVENWNNLARVTFTGVIIVAGMLGAINKDQEKSFINLISQFGLKSKAD
jgi:hypothetical protein